MASITRERKAASPPDEIAGSIPKRDRRLAQYTPVVLTDPKAALEELGTLLEQAKTMPGNVAALLSLAMSHTLNLSNPEVQELLDAGERERFVEMKRTLDVLIQRAGLHTSESFHAIVEELLSSAGNSSRELELRVNDLAKLKFWFDRLTKSRGAEAKVKAQRARDTLPWFEDAYAEYNGLVDRISAQARDVFERAEALLIKLEDSSLSREDVMRELIAFYPQLSRFHPDSNVHDVCSERYAKHYSGESMHGRAETTFSVLASALETWFASVNSRYDEATARWTSGTLTTHHQTMRDELVRIGVLLKQLSEVISANNVDSELYDSVQSMVQKFESFAVHEFTLLPTPTAAMPPLVFAAPPVVTTQTSFRTGVNEAFLDDLRTAGVDSAKFNTLYQEDKNVAGAYSLLTDGYLSSQGFSSAEIRNFRGYVTRLARNPRDIGAQRGLAGILRAYNGSAFVDAAGVSFRSSKKDLQMRVFLPTYAETGATWADGGVSAVVRLKAERLRGSGTTTDYNFDPFAARDSEATRPTLEREETLGVEGEVTLRLDKMTGAQQAPQVSLRFGKAGETVMFGARLVRADRTSWNRAIEDLVRGEGPDVWGNFFVDLLRTVSSVNYAGQVDGVSAHQLSASSSLLHFTFGPVEVEITGEGGATIIPRTAGVPGSVQPYGAVSVCTAVAGGVLVFESPTVCATGSATGNGTMSYDVSASTGVDFLPKDMRFKAGVAGTDKDSPAIMFGVHYEF